MQNTFVVLDQGVLRTPDLGGLIEARPDFQFVLPDLSFLEMTKSDQWESTLRNSLNYLATVAPRVFVCISVGEAMRKELQTGRAQTSHMISREATNFVRGLLASIRQGTAGVELDRIRADPDGHRQTLARDFLDHQQNKTRSADIIEATQEMFSAELQKEMRAKRLSEEQKLAIIRHVAPNLLSATFNRLGYSANRAKFLLKQKPMLLRYTYLKAWFCIGWIEKGGFDSIKDEKVTNHLLDHEYVLAATCFNGIFSKDGAVNEAYPAMVKLLRY